MFQLSTIFVSVIILLKNIEIKNYSTRVVAWSGIYQLQTSARLDHNCNRNDNPKYGKREMLQLEFMFESYFEVDDDM